MHDGESFPSALRGARRVLFHGGPPPTRHLHLLVEMINDSALGYLQGAPVSRYALAN